MGNGVHQGSPVVVVRVFVLGVVIVLEEVQQEAKDFRNAHLVNIPQIGHR